MKDKTDHSGPITFVLLYHHYRVEVLLRFRLNVVQGLRVLRLVCQNYGTFLEGLYGQIERSRSLKMEWDVGLLRILWGSGAAKILGVLRYPKYYGPYNIGDPKRGPY